LPDKLLSLLLVQLHFETKTKRFETKMENALPFNRTSFVDILSTRAQWDVIIIGGGATGLGIALDSASRGFSTLLLEQSDFAKGTSSRSTKLVHGGVRYLAQGDIRLVYDALRERGLLLKNASHLVKRQPFIIPCYSFFSKMKFLVGLKMYDWLAGRWSFGSSTFINKKEIIERLPGINPINLAGGIEYFDGQFDDARLAINIARTAANHGAVLLNYFKVSGLDKDNNKVSGVKATDLESGKHHSLKAKVVINATGVYVDDVLQMDKPGVKPMVRPSQGIHLVVNKKFLNGKRAMMIPETADGRVLFAVPWHNHILLGTTDTPLDKHSLEPVALEQEIKFILDTVKEYLTIPPTRKDVLSVFAGLRPLAAPDKDTNSTKEISRDHKLIVNESGLITITGGKWTTYRKMAEETVNKAIETGSLNNAACKTKSIALHGSGVTTSDDHYKVYGSDREGILTIIKQLPDLQKTLVEGFPNTCAEVVWAVRNEMARTIEDVLARRLRMLFLNAGAALKAAPKVAELIARELDYDEVWQQQQIAEFSALTKQYVLQSDTGSIEERVIETKHAVV
jgi:glycerol-3-phosphate dehydrogenase